MGFRLEQFDAVLSARDEGGKPFLLIGGQAVYFWATAYLANEPSLEQWLPFTSKDIDFQGNRADLVHFANQLGTVPRFPHKKEMTAWAGVAQIEIAGEATSVDFLRFMPGVKPHDTIRFAVEREFQGRRVRVVDPISLLSCKAYLALRINQKDRRDADHLRILVICIRAFLREGLQGVESGEISERGWLSAVERVLKIAESSMGKKATKKLGVDWHQALPLLEIGASRHRAAVQLREKRLPLWSANLARP